MVCVHRDANLVEACRLMRACGTSELMVITEKDGCALPLGTVSARDIAMRVVALELDPSVFTAGDIVLVHES
jgi:predicted transcriptional regulator